MTEEQRFPPEFLNLLRGVSAKRPRTVIDHILEHGQITTEELRDVYGYNHPPRAIRDVRERGIPIETFRVTGSDGRRIAAYRFGDPSEHRAARLSGRTVFLSGIKRALIEESGARCNLYMADFPENELQVDHRAPFEIAGEAELSDSPSDYMLLCASANRAKSWSCQHCENWLVRNADTCRSCYWASPERYSHVAMSDIRRLDIVWRGNETADYESIREEAESVGEDLPAFVKNVLRLRARRRDDG